MTPIIESSNYPYKYNKLFFNLHTYKSQNIGTSFDLHCYNYFYSKRTDESRVRKNIHTRYRPAIDLCRQKNDGDVVVIADIFTIFYSVLNGGGE